MTYLLDTNVLSEFRKVEAGRADVHVMEWARRTPPRSLFISIVTVLELEIGILQIERRDPRQGAQLRKWLDGYVLPAFDGRTLAIDTTVALRCAKLHVPDRRPERDALIAACALAHGMTVVTRNVADFRPTGVAVLNPWEPQD